MTYALYEHDRVKKFFKKHKNINHIQFTKKGLQQDLFMAFHKLGIIFAGCHNIL
jgi:hypothetical protein